MPETSPLELHRAYRRLFETADGRTVMADLERRGCFMRPTYSTDRGRTEFNEGRRSLVLHVKQMLEPDNFIEKGEQPMTDKNEKQKNWRMTLPEEWTVRQVGEDGAETEIPLRDHPALDKYATKDEAVKALVHAQRMLGKTPEGFVRVPGEKDSPEDVAAFHAALGRPEKPDGYELPDMDLPDGFEVREDLVGGLREKAFELGLTPKQVAGLYEWFLPGVLDTHHAMEAEAGKLRESELDSLRSVHRGDTPSLLDSALRAAEAVGGEELLAALDDTGAGNRAAVISAFAKIAPLVLESGLRGSARGWGEDLTIERLREMMQDPRYKDPTKRDDSFVKKVNRGFELLYPGDYVPGSRI